MFLARRRRKNSGGDSKRVRPIESLSADQFVATPFVPSAAMKKNKKKPLRSNSVSITAPTKADTNNKTTNVNVMNSVNISSNISSSKNNSLSNINVVVNDEIGNSIRLKFLDDSAKLF